MAYAIITLSRKEIINTEVINGKWADALNALDATMTYARERGLLTEIKGTWRRPYARRGESSRTTSFSAYTRGYSEFVYIKKVEDGFVPAEPKHRGEDLYDLVAERTHAYCPRPRSMEEREDFWEAYESGQFDY